MLARAELRYIKWRDIVQKSFEKSGSKPFPPPLDVAYMWHAHMLSPFRYYEDSVRLNQSRLYQTNLPLPALYHSAFDPLSDSIQNLWRLYYDIDEPYTLTPENVVLGRTAIECSFCKTSMECSWIEYANWRHDPNIGIKCHSCRQSTTLSTTSINRLNHDIEGRSYLIAGTLLDADGKIKRSTKFNLQKTMSFCIRKAEEQLSEKKLILPNRSIDDLERIMVTLCSGRKVPGIYQDSIKPLSNAIRGCYHNNPSPLSIDLIQAVGRQHEFNLKAANVVNWSIPYGIARGIRQYQTFLKMIKAHPKQIMVPTLEIDLAWHTHMLHPVMYRRFTFYHIGRMVNHDDSISPDRLKIYAEATDKAWRHNIGHNLINNSSTSEKSKRYFFGRICTALSPGFGTEYIPGTLPDSLAEEMIRKLSTQLSYHDRRTVKTLFGLLPNNSETLQSQMEKELHNSGYGYIGTVNCASSSVGKMGKSQPEIIQSTKSTSLQKAKWALLLSTPMYGLPFTIDPSAPDDCRERNIDLGELGNALGELMGEVISNTASTCGGACGGGSGGGCGGGGGGGCGGGGGGGGGGS
ncbi:hypothetical protein BJV82DRAFT_622892 [Fennellomyces sp. T-0311]|nr:hypothetical protein BJV82DRAFT_622892 [Fennellomyces sp. T-0311]